MSIKKKKAFHYVLMVLMSVVIVLSIGFVYLNVDGALIKQPVPSELINAEEAGNTKQLPEYMLKTLKNDELEQLKP